MVLSGNLRTFGRSDMGISDYYKKIADKYDCDVFCFTDDHHFYYHDLLHLKRTQEQEIDLGNSRLDNEFKHVDHDDACRLITKLLTKAFGGHLKGVKIIPYYRFFVPVDVDNPHHNRFYDDHVRPLQGKHNILNNTYKSYMGYKLLQEYETQNQMRYDLIIKSRFDCIPHDIVHGVDIRKLDYDNTLVCGHWSGFVFDHGAIGKRDVMHNYFRYYERLSPNLLDEKKAYWNTTGAVWRLSDHYQDGYDDISDSIEYGLTYLMRDLCHYQFRHYDINFRHHIAGPCPDF